jgi:riboflavin kinase/FMN adenylyltransferase
MIRITNLADFPDMPRGCVLSVGNFDGVHRGHASMLGAARTIAAERDIPFVIMTFDPHPMTVLRPSVPRIPLMAADQRPEALTNLHPDILLIMPTTVELLGQSAQEFLTGTVAGIIKATHIVEGPTFTFGSGAMGTVDMLLQEGPKLGFQTTIIPTAEQALHDCTMVPVSSSTIRWLVQNGRVSDALRCLGRPYTLRGPVVRGQQRGRKIGFPTANMTVSQLMPAPAVYAGRAIVDGTTYTAAISVGDNPTFAGQGVTVEAYLLDFDGDLYNKTIDLEFHRWLREQIKYGGIDPLVRQLQKDVLQTRLVVAGISNNIGG